MPVNFSIKNVPDELADALRKRARQNHRSLQGELIAIMEAAIREQWREALGAREARAAWNVSSGEEDRDASGGDVVPRGPSTISELYEYTKSLDLPSVSESTEFIRKARDER